jgi:hypothetical protein
LRGFIFARAENDQGKGEGSDMAIRTRESTVTFAHPFQLSAFDNLMPAGTYRLVTDEEEILGLSFLAYQRMATTLHTPSLSAPQGRSESVSISQAELDAALVRDGQEAV